MNDEQTIYFTQRTAPHPFYKKNLIFTGALSKMPRAQAAKLARFHGATIQGAVTEQTDFVILGGKNRGKSSKQLKAEQLIARGVDIQLIVEADFMWILSLDA